jgi:hypothetical protein
MEHQPRRPGFFIPDADESMFPQRDRNHFQRWLYVPLAALVGITCILIGYGESVAPISESITSLSAPDSNRITIACFYDDKDLPPLTFGLNPNQCAKIVGHLRNLKWNSPGGALAEFGMIRPDIDILLTDESGNSHTYQLYWTNNSFADQDSGLLFETTNISELRGEITLVTGLFSGPQPK